MTNNRKIYIVKPNKCICKLLYYNMNITNQIKVNNVQILEVSTKQNQYSQTNKDVKKIFNHKFQRTEQNVDNQHNSKIFTKLNKFFTIDAKPENIQFQTSSIQKEMRQAIQIRYNNSKIKEYKYQINGKLVNEQNDKSSHSSQMAQLNHLKQIRFYDLNSQNQKKRNKNKKINLNYFNRIKHKDKSREQSISSGNTQFHSARKYRIKTKRQNSTRIFKKATDQRQSKIFNKNQNNNKQKNSQYKQYPLSLKSLSPTSPYLQKIKFKSNKIQLLKLERNKVLSSNDLNNKLFHHVFTNEKKVLFKRNLLSSTQSKTSRFQKNSQSHKLLLKTNE